MTPGVLSTLVGMTDGFGGEGNFGSLILMMVIIVGIFYFLVIRPQRQQQQEHQELIENLESGDQVVTVGGIHGTITGVDEQTITLKVSKDFKLTVSREKVARHQDQNNDNNTS